MIYLFHAWEPRRVSGASFLALYSCITACLRMSGSGLWEVLSEQCLSCTCGEREEKGMNDLVSFYYFYAQFFTFIHLHIYLDMCVCAYVYCCHWLCVCACACEMRVILSWRDTLNSHFYYGECLNCSIQFNTIPFAVCHYNSWFSTSEGEGAGKARHPIPSLSEPALNMINPRRAGGGGHPSVFFGTPVYTSFCTFCKNFWHRSLKGQVARSGHDLYLETSPRWKFNTTCQG